MAKYIPLTRGAVAIVDDEDFDRISQYKWHCMKKGYAARRLSVCEGGRIVLMHQDIICPPVNTEIDHINRNKLDNRRDNLRIATPSQNRINAGPRRDNTTGYKGVAKPKRVPGYIAQIRHDGRVRFLGYFRNPKDAARAYNNAAKELYGEYAYLNPVED